MKVSIAWIQQYIEEDLPPAQDVADRLTLSAYEVEEIEALPNGDTCLSIDVLPNRSSDSLGHIGVAREISSLFNLSLSAPLPRTHNISTTPEHISLTLSPRIARRGMKALISGVAVKESPQWLKDRLESIGQRSINAIVDCTNFVMWETGNPVHAFDADKVETQHIDIRYANEGEVITALDGKLYALSRSIPVIADSNGPLDIAGIKGGMHSGVDEYTTSVLVSACSFAPHVIRSASRELGLRTDASKRFENDVPAETVQYALERLIDLIIEVAGGTLVELIDIYPYMRSPFKIGVSQSEIKRILGIHLSKEDITSLLKKVYMEGEWIQPRDMFVHTALESVGAPYKYGASVSVDAPSTFDCGSLVAYAASRSGLAIPRMVVDQFVYAYQIAEDELMPGDVIFSQDIGLEAHETFTNVSNGETSVLQEVRSVTIEYMPGTQLGCGVNHVGIYLGDGNVLHASGVKTGAGKVVIEKLKSAEKFKEIRKFGRFFPGDEERYVITVPPWRTDIKSQIDVVEEIMRMYGYNNLPPLRLTDSSHQHNHSPLFLIEEHIRSILSQSGLQEIITYAFRSSGEVEMQNAIASDKSWFRSHLYDGMKEALIFNAQYRDLFSNTHIALFEIGNVATDTSEERRLCIGVKPIKGSGEKELKKIVDLVIDACPFLSDSFSQLSYSSGIIEVKLPHEFKDNNLTELPPYPTLRSKQFVQFSAYPYIVRDIAFWAPLGTDEESLAAALRSQGGSLVIKMTHFDRFEKEHKISYGFRFVFQSHERTLTHEEVDDIMKRIYETVEKKGYEIR